MGIDEFKGGEVMVDEQVILVDIFDCPVGVCGKLEAHQRGLLHRAFSVFLYRDGQLLIQKRARQKYHSAGLWSNACCSHPRPGEELLDAAHRRLGEEIGVECEVHHAFSFIYRWVFPNGLTEYELDYVLLSEYNEPFSLNPEVDCVRYVDIDKLVHQLQTTPEYFTPWFVIAAPQVIKLLERGEL